MCQIVGLYSVGLLQLTAVAAKQFLMSLSSGRLSERTTSVHLTATYTGRIPAPVNPTTITTLRTMSCTYKESKMHEPTLFAHMVCTT